jgi:hypothetical protein
VQGEVFDLDVEALRLPTQQLQDSLDLLTPTRMFR